MLQRQQRQNMLTPRTLCTKLPLLIPYSNAYLLPHCRVTVALILSRDILCQCAIHLSLIIIIIILRVKDHLGSEGLIEKNEI